jgi:hypothetical protein
MAQEIAEVIRLLQCPFTHFDDIAQVLPNLDKQLTPDVAFASKESEQRIPVVSCVFL